MSQRNPMNDRYTVEDRKGAAHKSASSAKPKAKAASSVTIVSSQKTPQQKKAEAKAQRKKEQEKQRNMDRKYYNPDTRRYKILRRLWWVCLIGAVLSMVIMLFARESISEQLDVALLIAAYVLIIAAFVIDFVPIRRERRAYQERMAQVEAEQEREQKAAELRAKQQNSSRRNKKGTGKNATRNPKKQAQAAAEKAAAAEADADVEASSADESAAPAGFLGKLFARGSTERVSTEKTDEKTAEEEA